METKKMTLAEAQEFVRNTKYIVFSEDESKKLQEKLFKIGCGWFCGGPIVSHTEHPFLLVDKDLRLSYASKESYNCFKESQKEYQLKDDVLNIQIIGEPKFDPNTLQPFDKVLVKDGGGWRCDYFSHIDEVNWRYPIICVGSCWRFCIPYNDETKQLLGTTDEAPEFYRLD